MPLHMTKVAYGAKSLDEVKGWFAEGGDERIMTTRYLPKRHEEMVGGSLYWIFQHTLVARSPILRFDPAPDGRTWIVLQARLIPVEPRARRAHQGWRYLAEEDAPSDLPEGAEADALPAHLVGELARLGLV